MSAQPLASDLLSLPLPLPRRTGVGFEFLRYFAASGAALAVDFGLYSLSMRLGLPYYVAAFLGFSVGAAVAYVVSVKWVFDARVVQRAWLEFALFVAVGILGLLLTEALLWLQIGRLGWNPLLAKIGASGVVFMFNFLVRKTMLFTSGAR